MPVLPGIQSVPRANLGTLRAPALSAPRNSGAVGEALASGGAQLFEINEKFAQAKRASELTTANAAASRRLKELEFGFNDDPDFATFNDRFGSGAEQISGEIADGISDNTVRSAFLSQFSKSRLASEFNVRGLARKRQIDDGQGKLTRDLDTFAELLAGAKNDVERENIRNQAVLSITSAAETGIVGREEAATREISFLSKSDTIRARRLIQGDPDTALIALGDPEQFPDLKEDSRQRLFEQASRLSDSRSRERVRLADRAERKEDQAREEGQELNAAQLRVEMLDAPGSVTEQRLTSQLLSRKITLTDFNGLLRGLRTEEAGQDDPNTLLTLSADAIDADPTVPNRIFEAREAGLLTADTAKSMLSQHASAVKGGGVLASAEVKRERKFVNDTVGGVRGPLSVLDSESSTRLAAAIREFDDQVLSGKNPREVADDVVSRFRLNEPGITALPRPRYLVGTRNEPDLEATMRTTVEKFQAGEITRGEFAKEAELLKMFEAEQEIREKRNENRKGTNDRKR